jgi:hypothetical protein
MLLTKSTKIGIHVPQKKPQYMVVLFVKNKFGSLPYVKDLLVFVWLNSNIQARVRVVVLNVTFNNISVI